MTETDDRLSQLRIDRDQDDRRPRRPLAVVAVLLVLVAGAIGWWLLRERPAEVATAVVTLERAGSATAGEGSVLDASGYVVARLRATVSSKVTGKILDVLVEEGMTVEKGQVLARLDDAIDRRQVALAEAQLASAERALDETSVRLVEAERDLGRTESLVAGGVSSEAARDRDAASVEALGARLALGREEIRVAEQRLSLARQALDDTVIRAPFTGVAVTKDAQPGEMISPVSAGGGFTRTGICTLVDMASLEIEVDVNEAYINRVTDGQRVEATLDAYPDWTIPASVITTVPTADRQRATVRVRIAFDRLDPRLLPDMGVKVAFLGADVPARTTEEVPAPRLWLDEAAVRDGGGGASFVFRIAGGVASRRAVTLGTRRGGQVEVVDGLVAGDRVVLSGPETLQDGDAVVER